MVAAQIQPRGRARRGDLAGNLGAEADGFAAEDIRPRTVEVQGLGDPGPCAAAIFAAPESAGPAIACARQQHVRRDRRHRQGSDWPCACERYQGLAAIG